jgi:hypothetical protein
VVSAALYSINNNYVSFVDPTSGLPFRSQQTIREGMRIEDVTKDLNDALGTPAMPSAQTTAHPGTFDFLSAFYRLRSLPLDQGASYSISVQNGARLFNADVRVIGHETIKTGMGSAKCVVTEIRVRNDQEADRFQVRIYFSDDERHVPLLVTARHRAGEIRAELASAEFIKEAAPMVAGGTQPGPKTNVIVPPPNPTGLPRSNSGGATAPAAAAGDPAPLPELPFAVGEPLNFNFYMGQGAQPVGTASFVVRARAKYFNRDGLLLSSSMQTIGAMQNLFQVNDQLNSYVDVKTLLPFRTELGLLEGKRKDKWIVSINQDGGSALFDDGTRVDIPVGTHDLVSVFYALRSFDLTPPRRNAVSLLLNKRPRLLYITALRRETIQLGGKQLQAVELSLTTDGADGDKLALRLWVSTDRRRLPLRLTAQTPLGPVRADLAIIPTSLQ